MNNHVPLCGNCQGFSYPRLPMSEGHAGVRFAARGISRSWHVTLDGTNVTDRTVEVDADEGWVELVDSPPVKCFACGQGVAVGRYGGAVSVGYQRPLSHAL